MGRIPEHLKSVQARRERLALAVLAGVTFEQKVKKHHHGEYAKRYWYIAWMPLRNYFRGPHATKWEAVESAIMQLEAGHYDGTQIDPAANA